MHGAPRLPATYLTMFCFALVLSLWRAPMDLRRDALAQACEMARQEMLEWLRTGQCR